MPAVDNYNGISDLIQFFQGQFDKKIDVFVKNKIKQNEEIEKHKVLCKKCLNTITSAHEKISINSEHEHTFKNPSGIIYRIVLYKNCPGCKLFGDFTGENTWFIGFDWNFAICNKCQNHLGWNYSGETTFYGLILANLIVTGG